MRVHGPRVGPAAGACATLALVLALAAPPLAAGQARGSLGVRVVVVAPPCDAAGSCDGTARSGPTMGGATAFFGPPLVIHTERQGALVIRTLVF